MTEVRCRHCNSKLAERDGGWLVVVHKKMKLEIFAAGVAMVTCPDCRRETNLRLTTGDESVKSEVITV